MGSTWLAVDCLGVARKAKETATRNRPAWTRRRIGCPFLSPRNGFVGAYIGRWPGVVKRLSWISHPRPLLLRRTGLPCAGEGKYGWPGVRAVLDRLNSFGKNGHFIYILYVYCGLTLVK